MCQVLGPKTLGSNYHLPQDGVEELKTHLQQVVELTKKTKQQLQISAPTAGVSSTNQATSHSTPVAPSLTPCQDGHVAHSKPIESNLVTPIATNSTLENSTCGPESCGGRKRLVSASEILGFSSSSATDTSGPLESSVADTSVSETVDSSSTIDVTKTSDSSISIETCPVNTNVLEICLDATPSSTSAEQITESLQAEMIPSESSVTDVPMQTVKSAEEFKLRVKPLSLLVNSSDSSLQSKQSLSSSSKPSLHPYVSPLEHMKPKFRYMVAKTNAG
jgi:hypothetical protein